MEGTVTESKLSTLGATPIEVVRGYRRKVGLPEFNSVEWYGEMAVAIQAGADREAVGQAIIDELRQQAAAELGPVVKELEAKLSKDAEERKAREGAVHAPPPPPVAPAAPAPAPVSPAPAPAPATPANGNGTGSGSGVEVWTSVRLRHAVTPSGIEHVVVKPTSGSKWTKYGAPLWPELADQQLPGWRSWDFQQEYGLPEGKTQVIVQLKLDGKPEKVARIE